MAPDEQEPQALVESDEEGEMGEVSDEEKAAAAGPRGSGGDDPQAAGERSPSPSLQQQQHGSPVYTAARLPDDKEQLQHWKEQEQRGEQGEEEAVHDAGLARGGDGEAVAADAQMEDADGAELLLGGGGEDDDEEEDGGGDMEDDAEDPASRLNELEAYLRQPDAVMEPGIMDRLREYVLANGHPQQAVEHLTDSYVGGWVGW